MAGSDDLMGGLHELDGAREVYDLAWEYWRGDVPETFDSPAVRRALARSAGKYPINIAKIPIVALADRLQVTAFTALDLDGRPDGEADGVLQVRIVTANKLGLQCKRLVRNVLVFGDSYFFVWPGDDDGSVKVAYNDPRTTRVIYDPEDELTISYAVRKWTAKDGVRASLLYSDHLELGWRLREGAKDGDPKAWTRERNAKDVPNGYGRVPVFHFRTDLPYGSPEHADAWGAQDAVRKFAATMTFSGERSGLRDRYLLTEAGASLSGNSADSPDWDDDEDADTTTADNSRLRSGAGEVSVLEGIKAAGEWSAADPKGFMGPADWWAKYAAMVTRTPGRYADPGGQHPSGSALRVADAPLGSKTEDRREFLDGELRDCGSFALLVAGYPNRKVDVRWKPAGIVDDLDTWAIAESKIRAGVPVQVALTETGLYEEAEVSGWLADGAVEMDVARRITLLGQVASAVQGLGQGVALGLLTDQQAQSVIETTIGQLTPELTSDGSAG